MRKLIYLLILLALPLMVKGTLVPLDGTFWDAGVLTPPESIHVRIWGNGAIVDSMQDASPDSVYHDTLNRDYSAYDLLRLEWKIYFTSGTYTVANEDMSYHLLRADTLQTNIVSANASSIEDGDIATISTNAIQISGSGVAADSLELMMTDTTFGLKLGQFWVQGSDNSSSIFKIRNAGTGHAVLFEGAGGGDGLRSISGGAGCGMFLSSNSGVGLYAGSGGNSNAVTLAGSGSGHGLSITGGATGYDINADIHGTIDSTALIGDKTGYTAVAEDTLTTGDTVAVMPNEWVAADSTGYQGAASGLDSGTVYGAVAQANDDSSIALQPSEWTQADSTAYQGSASGLDSSKVSQAMAQILNDSGVTYNRQFKDINVKYAYAINPDSFLALPTDSASTAGGSDSTGGLHPYVIYFDSPFGADAGIDSIADTTPSWKQWMVYSGWNTEYTCIAASHDKKNWEIPYYIDSGGSKVTAPNPVNKQIKMSDPCLFLKDDTLFLIDREVSTPPRTLYRYSVNGVNWSDTVVIWHSDRQAPCVVDEDTAYAFYYNNGTTLQRLLMTDFRDSTTVFREDTCNLTFRDSGGAFSIKHSEVRKIAENKYLIVCHQDVVRGLYIGESNNGLNFLLNDDPVIIGASYPSFDYSRLYKASIVPVKGNNRTIGLDMYYSGYGTVNSVGWWHIGLAEINFGKKNIPLVSYENFVFNGNFEGGTNTDEVAEIYVPDGWDVHNAGSGAITNFKPAIGAYEKEGSTKGRMFSLTRYSTMAEVIDTAMVYQSVGYLPEGTYLLSGYIENAFDSTDDSSTSIIGIAIDTDTNFTGYLDSIVINGGNDTSGYFYKLLRLPEANYYVKLWCEADEIGGGVFDDIRLERIGDDPYGSGEATVTHYVRDTANSAMVSGVKMDVNTLAGTDWADVKTLSGGAATYNARVNDTLVVTCQEAGYVIPTDTVVIASTSHTDTTGGYEVAVGTPVGSNTCNVYFYPSDIGGDVQEKDISVVVTLSTQQQAIMDTCNGTVLALLEKWVKKPDPSTGQILFELIHSSCLYPPGAIYSIQVFHKRDEVIAPVTFTVPDSTTHKLLFMDY